MFDQYFDIKMESFPVIFCEQFNMALRIQYIVL